jgi:uncharacterized membrane protein
MNRWLVLMLLTAALTTAVTLTVWLNRADWLPEDVPVHWNAANQVDQTVPRDKAFWWLMIWPLLMFGWIGLVQILPWLSPKRFEIDTFRSTYDFIMGLVSVMFGYMQMVVLAAQTGVHMDMGRWIVGGLMLFMLVLGNVLGKVRKNFYVGVRTPWTLASDQVWTKTHRLAAWLCVGGSLIGLALVLIGVNALIAIVPFFVAMFVPIFYSLWLYKRLQREGKLDDCEKEVASAQK